ncbi:MAG: hypothetical protein KKB20_11415 [Proteobacteria bacterium]|nr:hypothetical protein [Pseudomonadota bacterium]
MDAVTLIVCDAVVPVFLFLALVFFQAHQKTYPGFGLWTAATLAIALGYTLLMFRPVMPLGLNIVVTNGLFFLGVVLRLAGVVRFMSGRRLTAIWYGALLSCLALQAYFYFVQDKIALRTLIIGVFIFIVSVRCVREVVRFAPKESRPLYLAAGAIYALSGLINMIRAVSIMLVRQYSLFDSGKVNIAYFLMMMVFELGWGLTFLMMNSQRLESELRGSEKSLFSTVARLEKTLAEVRTLQGFIPICSSCKKIRDDAGYWQQVEKYISDHSGAQFTHGICPECVRKLYPDFADQILDQPRET